MIMIIRHALGTGSSPYTNAIVNAIESIKIAIIYTLVLSDTFVREKGITYNMLVGYP